MVSKFEPFGAVVFPCHSKALPHWHHATIRHEPHTIPYQPPPVSVTNCVWLRADGAVEFAGAQLCAGGGDAAGWSIFFLLVVIVAMLGGVAFFMFRIARREKRHFDPALCDGFDPVAWEASQERRR